MQTVLDHRRANLRKLIDEWNGPLPLARKLGYANASFVVQMAGPNPSREVSEKTARMIEDKLGLDALWLDQPVTPAGNITVKRKRPREKAVEHSIDAGVISDVIRLVGQTAIDMGISLPPEKLAGVVAIVYDDIQASGELRPAFVQRLVRLTK